MVVHPAAGHASGTLVNALLHHVDDLSGIGGEKRPGIVHRLDRGTSGLMVVGEARRGARGVVAPVPRPGSPEGIFRAGVGRGAGGRRIDAPIGRDPANRKKMSAEPPKPAAAPVSPRGPAGAAKQSRGSSVHEKLRVLTLVQVAIHTGRTHQIRVHLSAIGHPIVGDSLYGGVHRRVPGDLRAITHLDRPFLHAARLVFKHPRDGRLMEFASELPEDLQRVLDELRARCGAETQDPWSSIRVACSL